MKSHHLEQHPHEGNGRAMFFFNSSTLSPLRTQHRRSIVCLSGDVYSRKRREENFGLRLWEDEG